ncbi:GH1 family beta-glucosidase [Aggregatilinea lenta]|uniref:GH1 family beta-glucosidase n=1 Tax=Aggregatilinea lenta TaxID=913108 RepID=UPI000E5BC06C|nr:GH1 family beta-glucosidase [Aggregatilinea lenta]
MTPFEFPSSFIWGAATASYQIEGAVSEDGRGESIWDRFSHTPGKVENGDTGDVAADHYHHYLDDVALMQDLGLDAYRFSIAWPRILPQGQGPVNEAGLDFYDRLVDALLAANITPFATLYHWDLPQALQDEQDGWGSRAIVEQFVHYADIVSRRLGDRVKHWTTHNEPYVFAYVGHALGVHAPGLADTRLAVQVGHHALLSHGAAVPVLRQNAGPEAQVGIVLNFGPIYTENNDPEVLAEARLKDAWGNRWFIEPVLRGEYPAELLDQPEFSALQIEPGDMSLISAPVDYIGINYYTRHLLGAKPDWNPERTEMGWEIYPQGLHDLIVRLHKDYQPKALYVTENGAAFDDAVTSGQVHDPRRTAYLRDHLRACAAAIEQGAPLKGYFVWSLMDNFEWSLGYGKRFGIVHIDYDTGQRRPKDSAAYYRSVIKANAAIDSYSGT